MPEKDNGNCCVKINLTESCLVSLSKGSKNQYLFIQPKQARSYISDWVYFDNVHDENII